MNEPTKINAVCYTLGLRRGSITILCSYANVGKTFFAGTLGLCVQNGLRFLDDIKIDNPGIVIHLDYDQDQETTANYYSRMANGLCVSSIPEYVKPDFKLDDANAATKLLPLLENKRLAIIDSLGASISKINLSGTKIRPYIDMLNAISAKTNCAILLLHHDVKGNGKDILKNVKGSGDIASAVGNSIHLSPLTEKNHVFMTLGKLRLTKPYSCSYSIDDVGGYSDITQSHTGIKLNRIREEDKSKKPKSSLMENIVGLLQNNKSEVSYAKKLAIRELMKAAFSKRK